MPRAQRLRVIRIGVVLIILIIPLWPKLFNSLLFARYSATVTSLRLGGDILSGRIELWREALNIFLEHPIIGIGWGGFSGYVSDNYRSLHGNVFNVHNIYLQFLAETGIIGTLVIVSSLLWITHYAIRQMLWLRNINEERYILRRINSIAIGIQVYFLILGLIDPCFMKYYFWVFFSISIILMKLVDRSIAEY